jgi:hypothetical protein
VLPPPSADWLEPPPSSEEETELSMVAPSVGVPASEPVAELSSPTSVHPTGIASAIAAPKITFQRVAFFIVDLLALGPSKGVER